MVMGAALAVFFSPLASALGAESPIIAIGGVAVVAWGGLVARLSIGAPWRRITALVIAANLAATVALMTIGLLADVDPAVRVVLMGIAVQVGAFAALQAHALWSPFVR